MSDALTRRNRLMARGGAALFMGEALLALAGVAAGEGFNGDGMAVLGVSLAAVLIGLVVYLVPHRLGRWGTHLVAAVGAVLVAVVVGVERPVYGYLYVWLALFVAAFFRRRAVVLHLAWMLCLDGVAIWVGDPLHRPLEGWLLQAGVLTGASAFILVVRRQLLELAARERETRALLDVVFSRAPVGLALFDRELRYVRLNETFASFSGIPASSHVGLRLDDVHPGTGPQVEPAMRHVLETGRPVVGVEAQTGGRVYRSSRYPVQDQDGETVLIAAVVDDVTHAHEAQQHLRAQLESEQRRAREDPLTELANRAALDERLERALAEAHATGATVGVIYLDLDGFKQVNDTYGHAAGDGLLRDVAGRLRAAARTGDLVGRIGGDEFLVLVTELDSHSARAQTERVAERLCDELEAPFTLGSGNAARLAATFGVALYPHDAPTAETLIAAADRRMYAAKAPRRLRSVGTG